MESGMIGPTGALVPSVLGDVNAPGEENAIILPPLGQKTIVTDPTKNKWNAITKILKVFNAFWHGWNLVIKNT